jgi:hypothetical protein
MTQQQAYQRYRNDRAGYFWQNLEKIRSKKTINQAIELFSCYQAEDAIKLVETEIELQNCLLSAK